MINLLIYQYTLQKALDTIASFILFKFLDGIVCHLELNNWKFWMKNIPIGIWKLEFETKQAYVQIWYLKVGVRILKHLN